MIIKNMKQMVSKKAFFMVNPPLEILLNFIALFFAKQAVFIFFIKRKKRVFTPLFFD